MCVLRTYSQQSQVKESTQALPVQMEVPVEEGGEGGEMPARYERDLVQKLKLLRHELALQQPQAGHCRIEVSREEIFEVVAPDTPHTSSISISISISISLFFSLSQRLTHLASDR